MTFSDLGLAESIVRAVTDGGYTTPTPIQAQAIPPIVDGYDMLGCAQTGTGKTAAFALPILHRLSVHPPRETSGRPGRPRALVLCPTRELATQIFDSFNKYGKHLGLRTGLVYGGVNQHRQVRGLRNGVEILVATPGRLLDLMNQGHANLGAVETLVLDEADHMLDMGFIRDIRKIVAEVPEPRQTLFFSATMPQEIRGLADAILVDPVEVKTAPVASPVETIDQAVFHVERGLKADLLNNILIHEAHGRTLVFSRTKHGADKIVKVLQRGGINSAAIHGNKSQNARERALAGFKSGKVPVLVATDIAARGIDVSEVTHVINYDLPNTPETYVHRIGRTARAGASGVAYTLCDRGELKELQSIERLIGRTLVVKDPENGEVVRESEPVQKRVGRGPSGGGGQPRRSGAGGGGGSGRSRSGGGRPGGRGSGRAKSRDGQSGGQRSSGGRPRAGAGAGGGGASKKRRPRREG